jgi:hypothetical protein
VFFICVVTDTPISADLAEAPAPRRDRVLADGAGSSPTGPLLCLVRALIDVGTALVTTLRQAPSVETLTLVTRRFGVLDVGVIIARIVRALPLAAALEAGLISGVAPWRLMPGRFRMPAPRKPRAAQAARGRASGIDAGLDRMPTAAEIAAEVRRRPVGAVIAELIRDFGIMPCHPLWRELSDAVICNGGSLAALYNHIDNRNMIAMRDPAFAPYKWPDAASDGQEAMPGEAALPAGWMPPHMPLSRLTIPWLPSPAASGAGPP